MDTARTGSWRLLTGKFRVANSEQISPIVKGMDEFFRTDLHSCRNAAHRLSRSGVTVPNNSLFKTAAVAIIPEVLGSHFEALRMMRILWLTSVSFGVSVRNSFVSCSTTARTAIAEWVLVACG
jgi:hypothetical protein